MSYEANLWDNLKRQLEEAEIFFQRIESSTALGIPDLWIGRKKKSAWVELKAVGSYPARSTTPVFGNAHGLLPEQIVWAFRATRKAINIKILASVGTGHNKDFYVVPGKLCQVFNKMTKEGLAYYKVLGGITAVPGLLLHRRHPASGPQAPAVPAGGVQV